MCLLMFFGLKVLILRVDQQICLRKNYISSFYQFDSKILKVNMIIIVLWCRYYCIEKRPYRTSAVARFDQIYFAPGVLSYEKC